VFILEKLILKLSAFLNFVIALFLSLMVILVFGNVVLRYAFNSGITWSEEVSRFLFIWSIFLGAIIALKDNEHLGVDTFVKKLSLKGKKITYAISNVLMLITLALIFDGSVKLTILNVDQSAPATGMPYAYIYAVGAFMCICMALIILLKLYRVLFWKTNVSDLIMTTDSEELVEQKHEEQGSKEAGANKS